MSVKTIYDAMSQKGALATIVDISNTIAGDINTLKNYKNNTSLIEVSAGTRVEPLTLVGTDCVHLEYLPDVLQSLLSIFAGYYLQAAAVMMQVHGVTIAKQLDRLNPDRKGDVLGASLSIVDTAAGSYVAGNGSRLQSDWKLNSLSYMHRLPTSKNQNAMAFENEFIALENNVHLNPGMTTEQVRHMKALADYQYSKDKNNREELRNAQSIEESRQKVRVNEAKAINEFKAENARRDGKHILEKDLLKAKIDKENKEQAEKEKNQYTPANLKITDAQIKSVREITDLSVGKMINITLGGGTHHDGKSIPDVTIPVSIRLMVNSIPDSSMIPLLSTGVADHSFSERYHAYKAGRIEFIRDLIFCQDIITENKKAMMHDHSGLHSQIIQRVNNNKLAGLANRDPSLNVASNLYVISEVTAKALEHKLGGKLSNAHNRDKIFDSGYAMIIVVIDREWEQITFYHRGIVSFTTVSLKDIKKASKGSGPDVGDILKAYQVGSAPQF